MIDKTAPFQISLHLEVIRLCSELGGETALRCLEKHMVKDEFFH